jgi:hypothetical protein
VLWSEDLRGKLIDLLEALWLYKRLRLKKRTFINSNKPTILHKEKEMANFRKLLLASAAVAAFASLTANGQVIATNQALQCVANAGVPPLVRAEGLTELVGDVTLNCQGGIPTQAGAIVPATNIRVFLNTNITSRILASNGFSEALLMIDEPHSTTNPNTPLRLCGDARTNEVPTNPGVCTLFGTGNGLGVYSGANPSPDVSVNNRPNVFQARQVAANAVEWAGVPVDPPGTLTTRIIRMTNIRANANQLGVSSTLVPTQITMYISITGSTSVPINNPSQTVAFIQVGLASAVRGPGNFLQCVSQNGDLAAGNTSSPNGGYTGGASTLGNQGYQFIVRATENFPSAFKKLNAGQVDSLAVTYPDAFFDQNIPGAIYNTEDAFTNTSSALGRAYIEPNPNPPAQLVGLGGSVPSTPDFPDVRGMRIAGAANHGTRLIYQFSGVPNGVQLWVRGVEPVISTLTGLRTGTARLVTTDSNGANAFSPTALNSAGLAQVGVFNGAGIAVYEVLFADAFTQERIDVQVAVAYVSNPANNLPTPGVQSGVTVSFAPLSTVGTASDTAPIPRFVPSPGPRNTFLIQKCNCNLLFPFVSNQLGYDTGVAISNTSLDTGTGLGATPQQGVITLNYYCGQTGCTSPPAQVTNAPVPAGQQLTFTLSGGGGYGIAATPGFQGYIIAQAQFQYCHAFAYISAQGALPTSNGASMGYLALVMDNHQPRPGVSNNESLGQ